ncbi:Uncharacterized protein OBRU01_11993 [Operophtera brumata]|uniref:Centrosomal protein of 162 kDa n=1 Tax=Operophtera brumata TaxID=104452 RepID=A0A0L7LB87_OPEBR|nr:Uncharacterized protein OBRU01_11993 [Operophtera brumata]
MAQCLMMNHQEIESNDNSVSTREFLNFEKVCEAYKDSDEEIKLIFSEINKLSTSNSKDNVIADDVEDVELILKRAEDIALETESLLKSSVKTNAVASSSLNSAALIPEIKVTKADNEYEGNKTLGNAKNAKQNVKHNNEIRRKPKSRPFSAGVIGSKDRESVKLKFSSNSPKKTASCKHDNLIEEIKDTNERAKSIELQNVQLNEDNKLLRRKLDQVNEEKHVADLKIAECEKFISRLGKEYENRNQEVKSMKDNEHKLISELTKERNEKKTLTTQHDKDAVVIHDLQRQVKEMEMILRRKHPDSVSALIVASKSSTVEDNKKKLLEERISRLEQELKDKETHFQGILLTLQEKFGDMKQKYESHIIDVERQLMEDRKVNTDLKNRINKTNMVDTAVQTVPKLKHTVGSQTFIKAERASSAVSRLSQNSALLLNKLKEDSYLVATIKGLQSELTVKQRSIAKINRETEELRKNLRSLQKEKEVLLHLNPHKKLGVKQASKSTENILARMNSEMEEELSEIKQQKGCLMNMQIYPLQEEIKMLNRSVEILQERVRTSEDKLMRYQAGIRDLDMHAGGDNPSVRSSKRDMR